MLMAGYSPKVLASSFPYLVTQDEFKWELTFQEWFTLNDVENAIREMEAVQSQYGQAKPKVIFKEPSSIYLRKKTRQVKEVELFFFWGSKSGSLCYSSRGRTGYFVASEMQWRNIKKIVLVHPNHPNQKDAKQVEEERFAKRLAKTRFDEQTWSHLEAKDFPNGHRFYYIDKVFDQWDLRTIQKAFEEKSSFRVSKSARSAKGRDFSASGKMGDDGIYRAWFSSEYADCGNGDYYLLLNPRVAVFCEKD